MLGLGMGLGLSSRLLAAAINAAYATYVTSLSPIIYLRMETGQLGKNDGTASDASSTTGVSNTTGKIGDAGDHTASGSRILIDSEAAINNLATTGNSMSIMGWLYWPSPYTGSGFGGMICSKGPNNGATSTGGWSLHINDTGGDLVFLSYASANKTQFRVASAFNGTTLRDQWVHVALVANVGTASHTIYLNGVPQTVTVNLTQSGTSTDDSGQPFRTACRWSGSALEEYLLGHLDELAVFDRALTTGEIAHAYGEAFNGGTSNIEDFESYSIGAFPYTSWTDERDRANFTIVSGQELQGTTHTSGADMMSHDASSGTDGLIHLEVTCTNSGSTNIQSGPLARWTDIDNCIFGGIRQSLGGLYITSIVGGSSSTATSSYSWTLNTKYYLTMVLNGSQVIINAYTDSARTNLVSTVSQTTGKTSAGKMGICHNADATGVARFDDFQFIPA